MRHAALIGAAGMLAYGAWLLTRDQADQAQDAGDTSTDSTTTPSDWLGGADDVLSTAGESAAEFVDSFTGGILQISAMAKVSASDLNNTNVRAMLAVIRRGEGTSDANGYRRIFGGQLFESYADHPRIVVNKSGYKSSAAGAYQALASTWDETKRIMKLLDFSPTSQDMFALGRIAARGALADVKAGRFADAVRKVAKEWASLPGSPYGQPTISMETARGVFVAAGGSSTATA